MTNCPNCKDGHIIKIEINNKYYKSCNICPYHDEFTPYED